MYWLLLFPLALALGISWLYRAPSTAQLASKSDPVTSFEDALKRYQALNETEAETGPLLDVCKSRLLTHGHQTEHAIVLLHGYTNCPEQFARLGERFYELGHNVFIPRLPYHGYADRLTPDIGKLTAKELVAYGDTAVDLARGLGRRITVIGLSGTGTVASWLAQVRSDVDFAFPMAALFGVSIVPAWLTRPLTHLLLALPGFLIWWDPRTKADNPYSYYHAYPRYGSRSLAHFLRLGIAVQQRAASATPACAQITIITNAAEPAVNNRLIRRLTQVWRKHAPDRVQTYEFDASLRLPHDFITPGSPGVPTEWVYDRLVEQVEQSLSA